ncbi:MAG: DUF1080 domain-containing protein [Deltaproteobacteria bacterium]|nr:DUF1080 domain-containing protein [Deltaproteobacteria bacterium]MBW2626896.1 DUF1080 domain-containing protein [Deltaproteobacteria bacterium]
MKTAAPIRRAQGPRPEVRAAVPVSVSALAPVLVCVLLAACTPQGDPGIGSAFSDDFERTQLGDAYKSTGGNWRIENGELHVKGAKNHPLWLLRTLPRDARVEFDVRSESPEGDIKVEVFGDGASYARDDSYTATSYVIIFGGWDNSRNVLARMDEHGDDRVVGKARKVEPGETYRFRIERIGGTLTVWVDGDILLEMDDAEPLAGRGHDHFGFNNWQSDLWFDKLKVTPL